MGINWDGDWVCVGHNFSAGGEDIPKDIVRPSYGQETLFHFLVNNTDRLINILGFSLIEKPACSAKVIIS